MVMLNNRIDVEKDVSILFGEILNEFNIDFAMIVFILKQEITLHISV
jgi:hypothetical protein